MLGFALYVCTYISSSFLKLASSISQQKDQKVAPGFQKAVCFVNYCTYRRRKTEMKVNSVFYLHSFHETVDVQPMRTPIFLLVCCFNMYSDPRFRVHPSRQLQLTPMHIVFYITPQEQFNWRQIWRSRKPSDWGLRSSVMLRGVDRQVPTFQNNLPLPSSRALTLEYGSNRSRNVGTYRSTPRNITEERKSHLRRGGSMRPRK